MRNRRTSTLPGGVNHVIRSRAFYLCIRTRCIPIRSIDVSVLNDLSSETTLSSLGSCKVGMRLPPIFILTLRTDDIMFCDPERSVEEMASISVLHIPGTEQVASAKT